MTDRMVVQNTVPIVPVLFPDGSTQNSVPITMTTSVDNGLVETVLTPTVDIVTNYAANDAVGGKLTFPGVLPLAGAVEVDNITITNLNNLLHPLLDLVLFNADFTPSNDNAAFDPSDADLLKLIGVLPMGDWFDFTDNAYCQRSSIGLRGVLPGTAMYGQLVTRSAFNKFTTTSDLQIAVRTMGA